MFHPDTQHLIETWTRLAWEARSSGLPPVYASFRPETLGSRMLRAFVLELGPAQPRFRLAGSAVEDLHGRLLTDAVFSSVWTDGSGPLVQGAVDRAAQYRAPVVIVAQDEAAARIEVALTPFRHGQFSRLIGIYGARTPTDRRWPILLGARLAVSAGENTLGAERPMLSRKSG